MPAINRIRALRTALVCRTYRPVFNALANPLAARFSTDEAQAILAEARWRFGCILPALPDVGGALNVYSPIVTFNGAIIAVYRALAARGLDDTTAAQETVRAFAAVMDTFFKALPPGLLHRAGEAVFTEAFKRLMQAQAARSRQRRFPADWVYEVRLDEDGYARVLAFSECAVIKLYEAQDVPALAPYCNFADTIYSRYMGLDIDASQTLGLGCAECQLKYRRGATTPPPNLQGLLPV